MPWRCIRQKSLRRSQITPILRHEQLLTIDASNRLIPYVARSHLSSSSVSTLSPDPKTRDASPSSLSESSKPTASRFSKNANLIAEPPLSGRDVRIAGLVRSIRKQKRVAFAHISDGSTFQPIQAILSPENAKDLHNGAYVELDGSWKESPGTAQTHEIEVEKVLRVGKADVDVSPIQKKSMTVDHLRNYPHLRLRLPRYSLLSRVRSQVISSVHEFYSGVNSMEDEATFVQAPIITSSDCEGAGEVFTLSPKLRSTPHVEKEKEVQVQYFRSPKYLTVSSQLHLEAFSSELGDVWTMSPAFRAEESDTGRHLSELHMIEAEFRGLDDLPELMARVERLIRHVAERLRGHRVGQELLSYYSDNRHRPDDSADADLSERWSALTGPKWQTITYAEAIKALEHIASLRPSTFTYTPSWDNGLQLEHEKWIVENLGDNKPVFVTHYPKNQKPFYMLPSSVDTQGRETVECFDLLFGHGTAEVVGGSLREHRLENLIHSMRDKGLLASSSNANAEVAYPFLREQESLGSLAWYADIRRYGSAPHGGWGLGMERLLMYLTGVTNVRDIVAFPRTYKNCIA